MCADRIQPDLITFTTILNACVKAAREGEDGGREEAMLVLQVTYIYIYIYTYIHAYMYIYTHTHTSI